MNTSSTERTDCATCGSVLLVCANCGTTFPRGEDEPPSKWSKRRYCSTPCAQAQRQKLRFADRVLETKTCEFCQGVARQRQGESPATFSKRKYCSLSCMQGARRKVAARKAAAAQERRDERVERTAAAKAEQAKKEEGKKLLRDVPIVYPTVAPDVWRPAAWRELDEARR